MKPDTKGHSMTHEHEMPEEANLLRQQVDTDCQGPSRGDGE